MNLFVLPTSSRRKCPQLSVSRMNPSKLKKEIEFSTLEMDANAFREVLYEAYPKLRDGGGFQLCRCIPNSRELEPLSRHVLSSPRLLKERVGQAHTYIAPLQRDLNVTPSVDDPKSAEKIGELIIIFCNGCQSGKNTHHCLTPELHVL